MKPAVRGVLASASLLLTAFGCSSPASRSTTSAHPEAVTIDFHQGQKTTAHCSGTLIAPNVVLTSARCADGSTGARIVAPAARGQTSSALVVERFDWQSDDPKANHDKANDLALVVLRAPIAISQYAAVVANACEGCSVVQVARASEGMIEGGHTRLSRVAPPGKPHQLSMPVALTDAGGPVLLTSSNGHPLIAGVVSGVGAKSKAGYVARVSAPRVHAWIRDIVASASQLLPKSSGTTTKSSVIHVLDDPPPDNTDQPPYDGNQGSDPVSGSSSGDPSSSSSSSSGSSGDGTTGSSSGDGASSSSSGSSGDATSGNAPVSGEAVDGGDPSGTPDGASSGGSSSGGSSSGGTNDPNGPAAGAPPDYGSTGEVNCRAWGQGGGAGDDTGGISNCRQPGAVVERTDNSWTKFVPGDGFGEPTKAYADDMAGIANVIGAHGFYSNGMWGVPDPSVVQGMAQNGQPIILASCFGGRSTPLEDNQSNAQRLASTANVDPSTIYGCTGIVANGPKGFMCDGEWRDGNNQPGRPPGARLQNCVLQVNADMTSVTDYACGDPS